MNRPRAKEPDKHTPKGQWAIYLAHLMQSRGVTAKQLADHLGKSRSIIFRYLRGDAVPSLSDWQLLAGRLGFSSWRDLVPPEKFLRKLGD